MQTYTAQDRPRLGALSHRARGGRHPPRDVRERGCARNDVSHELSPCGASFALRAADAIQAERAEGVDAVSGSWSN